MMSVRTTKRRLFIGMLAWLFIPAAQCACEITKITEQQPVVTIPLHLPEANQQALFKVMESLPDTPLNLGNSRDFFDYTVRIRPLLERDYLAQLSSHLSHQVGVAATGLDDLPEMINSPGSYLRLYAHLGEQIRRFVQKKYGIDLAYLDIASRYEEPEKIPDFPFKRVFPRPLASLSEQDMLTIISALVSTVYNGYLYDRGMTVPPVFTGPIDSSVANNHAEISLFLDDPLFTGQITHGKFTHLLTLIMLMEAYPHIDTEWLSGFVRNNHWGDFIDYDLPLTRNQADTIQLSCATPDGAQLTRRWRTITWPSGHSPAIQTQLMMRNAYSLMVDKAANEPHSRSFMYTIFGLEKAQQPLERLNRARDNIRALENLIAMDFHNDIRAMFQFRKYLDGNLALAYVAEICGAPSLDFDTVMVRIGEVTSRSSVASEACRNIVDFYLTMVVDAGDSKSTVAFTVEDFRQSLLQTYYQGQRSVDTFYRHYSVMLQPVRRAWVESRGLQALKKGDEFYLIYALPTAVVPAQACKKPEHICRAD